MTSNYRSKKNGGEGNDAGPAGSFADRSDPWRSIVDREPSSLKGTMPAG